MLWVFLITTMITIIVNSTKNTNALEVEDENWNIQLVMYDRSSDTPNDAITEFTWNAVDVNETKQLCMQINYACTTNKGYKPGEIEIKIPGIAKDSFSEYYRTRYLSDDDFQYTIAADKIGDTQKKYDWSYDYSTQDNVYIFKNNKVINENEHFEGTIQILYNLNPRFRVKTDLEFKVKIMENIEDASEKIAVESNVCKFHYTSIKKIYSLTNGSAVAPKTDYTKIEDILDDYYWVRYSFGVSRNHNGILKAYDNNGILVTDRNSSCIKEILQDECVLYDANLNKIEAEENNIYYYLNPSTSLSNPTYYYVGYPKYKYNDGDKITNTVELWGRYEDEEEFQKLSEKSQTISLVDFDFEYTGKLYNIEKSKYIKEINENNIKSTFGSDAYWNMDVTAFYTGSMMDVEICDDLLYITRENGSVSKLNEDEYRFKSIEIPVLYTYSKFTGSVGDVLSGYNYEVQVRYEGSNEYVRYRSGVTSASSKRIYFRSNDVVGVKFIIKDLDKTLYPKKGTTLEGIKLCVNINTNDCKTRDLYNFNYLQVYEKDSEGNRELANEVELDNYITPSTLKIAEYDINTYGTYMQRDYDIIEIKNGSFKLGSSKSMENLINNVKKEKYETQYKINNILEIDSRSVDKECIIKQYDVLPDGVKLASTKEEIKDEIYSDIAWKLPYLNLKLKDGTKFKTLEELINYIKENTTVEIDYNYKDSGRTKISLIYNLNNIDWSYYLKRKSLKMYLGTKLNVEIPYDSILEYGTSYTNYVYSMWDNQEYEYNNDYLLTLDESDIDEDGDTTETLVFDCAILNINHVIASQQTVIKQVRTDLTKGEFTSRSVDVTAGSEYTYKLKVKQGQIA